VEGRSERVLLGVHEGDVGTRPGEGHGEDARTPSVVEDALSRDVSGEIQEQLELGPVVGLRRQTQVLREGLTLVARAGPMPSVVAQSTVLAGGSTVPATLRFG
jgi:hypothetical protein